MRRHAEGSPAALFELAGIRVEAGGRTLLDGITHRFAPGRICGLIGPNGSGKSTLMRLLARQAPSGSGRIRFHGEDLAAIRPREFARQVAYLPQFTPPTDGMRVEELVALGRFPWHGLLGRFGARDREKVDEALRRTGTGAFRGRAVASLSGGERQRVWLAMLLAQDAACLLLDEPTSALDIAHQIDVLSLVRALGREGGLSVIVILHDINMAARFCDDIVALGHGRIVAQGTPDAVMREDVLARIYGLRMGIHRLPGTGDVVGYPL
ncbi:ABC transporter ATP-binding protein [Methylobacterium frigidaeris]|jgi:ferric hydroxamate transport system ATP-binding protein|uniref:Iron(3+)-hydroxamate import ATP-binding protein FhuC n=1 Tax=Methylobacterium frigidaeris TaxID=2038277 RepID=A0AA37M788_9HYPH|nr:ATP-binding cassette domain-containing protein [Methylobacterium frigidaeris]PIK72564.1 iron ABC transporter substrate-binding protein [Methylobacterium frigidaeris]GJD64704.1 Iron(3+)-hydroxamate import ATP-binding protein FhuC [Methylobacterium frigidaeris]